jgi:erythromycin esterase-like protein
VVAARIPEPIPALSNSRRHIPPGGGQQSLVDLVRAAAYPLQDNSGDYDPLMELVGDARFVLLGEATHGTHEFYAERARITRRLIEEKGFSAVAIEGDWPDAYRVNRYVRGLGAASNAEQSLEGFTRFPRWMWRNAEIRELVDWLRNYNTGLPVEDRAGFYGLDLYSLPESADNVVDYLRRTDPRGALQAEQRYSCFARHRNDLHRYGAIAAGQPALSCEAHVTRQWEELRRQVSVPSLHQAPAGQDERFAALQDARLVKNAEAYYRLPNMSPRSSWELRDQHMAETLDELAAHLGRWGRPAKIVAWAHNTHAGDARATEGIPRNLGQMMRERHNQSVVLVGFTTYDGSVIAAREWDAPGEHRQLRPALEGSYADLFHDTGLGEFLLPLRDNGQLSQVFGEPRLQRAVGVVYLPESERQSHYLEARLAQQFDALIHIDTTRAVEPLAR